MRTFRIFVLVAFALTVATFAPASASSQSGRYIVSLHRDRNPETTARDHSSRYGVKADRYFRNAIKGYAANIPEDRVAALREDPSVLTVSRNRVFRASAQTTPDGVKRVGATTIAGTGEGVYVAVLDSGIEKLHPDLAANLAGGVDCDAPYTGNFDDGNGHGTHVAGTIAAIDNGTGVRGVAPSAKLLAVRVLDESGAGDDVSLLCGIDWVDARAPANLGQIQIANMSLEAPFDNIDDGNCGFNIGDPVHQAICEAVDDGVTFTVAAGNFHDNIKDIAPAAYDEVITATALADYDGAPCSVDPTHANDDTFASFSSFATLPSDKAHTLGAPGVEIASTWILEQFGGYAVLEGTSMASPHIAGIAARYLQTHPGTSPAGVLQALKGVAEPENVDFNGECTPDAPSHTDPSGQHDEPVARVADWSIDIQASTPGVVRGNSWILNSGFDSFGNLTFGFASQTDRPVTGDWDGDGDDEPAAVRGNVWYLGNEAPPSSVSSFTFAGSNDRVLAGDWDDDGDDEPAAVRGNVWYLANDVNDGPPTSVTSFTFASPTDRVVAGDWDGDGDDEPAAVRGNVWYLANNVNGGPPTSVSSFAFASVTDLPIAGDWDGDGDDNPGVVRKGTVHKWFLNLGLGSGAVLSFIYGHLSTDRFVAGDWDGENP